ncbi:hypothetical protein NQ314_021392 [Rhamnusium bicolor]|uniref:Uncharacterized protein n=1 Tax=Rhamnusium bicolor TaxID=1586634 RepID=A0AAV8WJ35_9CUCU|nr:hypothetical protein NQ314_021392 [Rhamnusium bicolor]
MVNSKALLGDIHPKASDVLKCKVFPVLKNDDITNTIRYDRLLIIYGNIQCQKYRDQHHYDMIRSRLRLMGRFLTLLKSKCQTVTDFDSVYNPRNFDSIVETMNEMGNYDKVLGVYEKPTIPTTIGTALKYIGKLKVSDCIKNQDEKVKAETENLMALLKTDLNSTVNKTAAESLLKQKRQKTVILPSTEDIKTLNLYLLENLNKHYQVLMTGFNQHSFLQLNKLSLIKTLVFNRRRPGELQRALVTDYKNLQVIEEGNHFSIRGKLGRGVPVLITKHIKKCLDLLLSCRKQAGVDPNNPYLFGIPQTKNETNKNFRHLRAVNLIRKYSVKCGANPALEQRSFVNMSRPNLFF